MTLAKAVLVTGLVIQIVAFAVFAVFAGIYQSRALRAGEPRGNWTKCLYTLYAGCALILIRSVYRTVEFASSTSNTTGYLLEHEWICRSPRPHSCSSRATC